MANLVTITTLICYSITDTLSDLPIEFGQNTFNNSFYILLILRLCGWGGGRVGGVVCVNLNLGYVRLS